MYARTKCIKIYANKDQMQSVRSTPHNNINIIIQRQTIFQFTNVTALDSLYVNKF